MTVPGFAPAQRVFPCPHCKEFINTSLSECKFCGTAVDYEAAQRAAEIQEQTAKACSDANYLKVTARTMPIFYLVSWVPIVGGSAGWGFLFLLFAVPIMGALWWSRHRTIPTTDPDYKVAKRSVWISLIIWGATAAVWFIVLVASIVLSLLAASRAVGTD